jgi:D-alanyl-D-alanine carboxypeptidase/D-alanyl-D-alanine-endopeptidase (penicillin-binding protein 4)
VRQALKRAGLPEAALSVAVAAADAADPPRLSWQAERPVNPASVMKLVTTQAALDLLGPDFTWRTGFYVDGQVSGGLLRGNLHVRGGGDPKFVVERVLEALQAVRERGLTVVRGDIVIDDSAFRLPRTDPAAFDGERLRPYNASPEALLVNFKSVILKFAPDEAAGVARVSHEPPLAGLQVQAQVPLSKGGCGDWRGGLQARFDDPHAIRFGGSYPVRCAERPWPVAYVDPEHYAERAIEGLWREAGGLLTGGVRRGPVPAGAQPWHEAPSLPLADIVADVNKFSNNVMAQQVFLTLGRLPDAALKHSPAPLDTALAPPATFERSRELLARWWQRRVGRDVPAPVLDNGAGLSRDERISALSLLALLRTAAQHPHADVLMRSLAVAGVDGTASRMGERGILQRALGNARVKTGSLRDVASVAGYVQTQSGGQLAVVAIVNHPHASQARPVLDTVLEWAASQVR